MTTVTLSKNRQAVRQQIIDYGNANGFSPNEISYALKAAFVESGFNPNASKGVHTGLYQYDDQTWNDRHADLGLENKNSMQINAFYSDIRRFEDRFIANTRDAC